MSSRESASLVEVVALSVWLGAAVFFSAAVAPSLFAVLPARALAGAVVERLLPVIFYAGIVAGVAVFALGTPARSDHRAWTLAMGAVIAVACAVAQFGIAPRIARVRAAIPGAVDDLPATDARRIAFGRLHAFSVGWLGLAMLAAIVALIVAARGLTVRTNPEMR